MRRDRLLQLAAFLMRVPDEHFSMRNWGQEGFAQHACGTAACAMGWATVCFADDGLAMDYTAAGPSGGTVVYGEHYGFEAAAAFFDLSSREADTLFGGSGTRAQVIRWLRTMAHDGEVDHVAL